MCSKHGMAAFIKWQKSHFPFLCQYATGCHLRMGSWGAHPRPPHYGSGLTNSFSHWSSVAPISCLLFLTVLLPTNENELKVKKENDRFNVETVVANYCFGTWNIGTLKGKSGEVCEVLCRREG